MHKTDFRNFFAEVWRRTCHANNQPLWIYIIWRNCNFEIYWNFGTQKKPISLKTIHSWQSYIINWSPSAFHLIYLDPTPIAHPTPACCGQTSAVPSEELHPWRNLATSHGNLLEPVKGPMASKLFNSNPLFGGLTIMNHEWQDIFHKEFQVPKCNHTCIILLERIIDGWDRSQIVLGFFILDSDMTYPLDPQNCHQVNNSSTPN